MLIVLRSLRSAPRRSRTSVSGSATIRAPVPTTCTRSTVRCPVSQLSMLSTKIWPPATDRVSGLSRYVINWSMSDALANNCEDPQGCRAREDHRYPPPIHQAASGQELEVPSAPPRQQEGWQEGLCRQATINFLLSVFLFPECGLDGQGSYGFPSVMHASQKKYIRNE